MRVMEMHASMRIVQRSKGRTATAAAAYRSAARIECERSGQVHDYTKKRGVEATEIHTAPDAPDWARDRSRLWNAAEMREKHPRAQTAREVEVSFPHEFNAEQRREAGRGIAQLFVSRYGSAADVAWHEPNREGDQRNYHAHVLFTTRGIDGDGWAATKRSKLDEKQVYTDERGDVTTGGQEELKSLRGAIANVLNGIAARDRLEVYVEHLSFEERGLDREATQHMGPDATEMERRGEDSDIGNKNREVRADNARREELQAEYDNVVDIALARQQRNRREPWLVFYRESQLKRERLNETLDRQYAQQHKDAAAELQQMQQAQASRNFFARTWHRWTGRQKLEDERADGLNSTLRIIEEKKRLAYERFETERVQRLEAMKADMQQADRADRERFEEFLRTQERRPAEDRQERSWDFDEGDINDDAVRRAFHAQAIKKGRLANKKDGAPDDNSDAADAIGSDADNAGSDDAAADYGESPGADERTQTQIDSSQLTGTHIESASAEGHGSSVAQNNDQSGDVQQRVEEFKARMRAEQSAVRERGTDRSVG